MTAKSAKRPTGSGRPARRPAPPLEAVVDLLGMLAYGELSAFERMGADARLAPSVADKALIAEMAVAEFGHYQTLIAHLRKLKVDPEKAMAPFVEPIDRFHDLTAPSDWLEGLIKAYVGDGLASDFYREIAGLLDPTTKRLVLGVLKDLGHAEFAVDRVRAAIAVEPAVAGRLALWARRLVGEAMTQAQVVAAQRDSLALLLVGVGDLAELGAIFKRITTRHSERMAALGLAE